MSNLVTLVATCTPCGPWVSRPTSSWETEPGCISDVFHPGRQPRTATRLLRLKLAERGCLPTVTVGVAGGSLLPGEANCP